MLLFLVKIPRLPLEVVCLALSIKTQGDKPKDKTQIDSEGIYMQYSNHKTSPELFFLNQKYLAHLEQNGFSSVFTLRCTVEAYIPSNV